MVLVGVDLVFVASFLSVGSERQDLSCATGWPIPVLLAKEVESVAVCMITGVFFFRRANLSVGQLSVGQLCQQ